MPNESPLDNLVAEMMSYFVKNSEYAFAVDLAIMKAMSRGQTKKSGRPKHKGGRRKNIRRKQFGY